MNPGKRVCWWIVAEILRFSANGSLPALISGRGVRLISSATVKRKGKERGGGIQTFVAQLVLMTFHMQHPGSAANITNAPYQLGDRTPCETRWRRRGGWGWMERLEDSNQTCCDINTAHGGNLVGKIRYDYGEREQRDGSSQSNQRLFEAISRWINTLKFFTLIVCFHTKEARRLKYIQISGKFQIWGSGACRELFFPSFFRKILSNWVNFSAWFP